MKYLLSGYNYDLSDSTSIPYLILQHLYLVGIAMAISLLIAIPLGVLAARYRWFYLPVMSISAILYSIPGIALLAILITIPWLGLSPITAIIPLVLYNQLVLIRNIAAAINGIDPLTVEVGKAMGMNSWQLFTRVIVPLALPVTIAGIRIATVTTIGIASLASLVNEGGLGDLIFKNLTSGDNEAIIAGAILLSLFALLADLLLLGLQLLLSRGRSVVAAA